MDITCMYLLLFDVDQYVYINVCS